MTQEEKAKAYDKVLERARTIVENENASSVWKDWLKNNFPELRVSENEKVRKALLEMVHDTTGDELWVDYNVHKEEALAWLKKQTEQKPIEENKGNFGGISSNSEWSEEDEKTLNEIFSVAARASLRKSTLFGKSYDYIKWQNWLKSLKGRVQPKQEWSEEDEEILYEIITDVKFAQDRNPQSQMNQIIFEEEVNWLESIKQRILG